MDSTRFGHTFSSNNIEDVGLTWQFMLDHAICLIICKSENKLESIFGIKCAGYFTCRGNAVAQWLKCCATNRKVAGVIGIFH